jgi:hypothetical protein
MVKCLPGKCKAEFNPVLPKKKNEGRGEKKNPKTQPTELSPRKTNHKTEIIHHN